MIKDIKEETYYGTPMFIAVYADKDGVTIPLDFVRELDPPPHGLEIVLSPYLEKSLYEKLVDFYEDIDFYGFRDTLEVGETKADAVEKLANDCDEYDSKRLFQFLYGMVHENTLSFEPYSIRIG